MSIHTYAENGNKAEVGNLIHKGENVNALDSKFRSPIHYAAIGGFHEIVAMLLKAGASVNITTGRGTTPLHYAARSGKAECLPLLLGNGADINCKDSLGNTALLTSLLYTNEPSIPFTLINNYELDVNEPNEDGTSPIHVAVQKGYQAVVQALVEKGAKLDQRDPKGNTAFSYYNLTKPTDTKLIPPEEMNKDIQQLYLNDDENSMNVDDDSSLPSNGTSENGHHIQDKIQSHKYYSDLSFQVEGRKIPSHKCIVSVRSPSFIPLINQSNSKDIEINDISYDVFSSVIEWIYKNKISKLLNMDSNDVKFIISLLFAGERFNIKPIISQCEYFLIKALDAVNISFIWESVLKSDYIKLYCPNLMKQCAYIIIKNWNVLVSTKLFSEMKSNQILELLKLINTETPRTQIKPTYPSQVTSNSSKKQPSTFNGKSAPTPVSASPKNPAINSTPTDTTPVSKQPQQQQSPSSTQDNIIMDEKNKIFCKSIVTAILKKKNSTAFHKPVDPILEGIPDYPNIIKNPMDLSTIRSKLDRNQYKTIRDYAADMRLMFQNALTYNADDSLIFKYAKLNLQFFDQKFISQYPNEKIPIYKQLQPPPVVATTTPTPTTPTTATTTTSTPTPTTPNEKKRKAPEPQQTTPIKVSETTTPTKTTPIKEAESQPPHNDNNNSTSSASMVVDQSTIETTPITTTNTTTNNNIEGVSKYTDEEKKTIMESIYSLEMEQIKHIFTIVDSQAIKQIGENLELDITELSDDNLTQIEHYLNLCQNNKKMKVDQVFFTES